MERNDVMKVDMRIHEAIRQQVDAGLSALRVQSRQIWGVDRKHTLEEIVVRLMVGVGYLARLTRNGRPDINSHREARGALVVNTTGRDTWNYEVKKELGNVLLSTIRWIDDLGLDVLKCLDLAIGAQEQFVDSKRPR